MFLQSSVREYQQQQQQQQQQEEEEEEEQQQQQQQQQQQPNKQSLGTCMIVSARLVYRKHKNPNNQILL